MRNIQLGREGNGIFVSVPAGTEEALMKIEGVLRVRTL